MRIVAGSARGRVLATPKKADVIRPTADRVRETLFNVLGQSGKVQVKVKSPAKNRQPSGRERLDLEFYLFIVMRTY